MGKKASFVAITEEYLISKINTAKTRVAFIGAGFNSNVADAVVKKMKLVENITVMCTELVTAMLKV